MTAQEEDTLDTTQADDLRDPTIVEALATAITARLALVNTAFPATVLSYDRATQRATVQPAVRTRLADGTTQAPPAIARAPVIFPGAGAASITWDLAPGDPVLLLVAQSSIDEWQARGGRDVVPGDPRRFDAADALVLPGLRPAPQRLTGDALRAATLVLKQGSSRIEIRADGVVTIFATEVRLGDDSAVALALAAPTQQAIDALYTAMTAVYTWGATVTPPLPAGPDFPGDLGPPPAPPIPPTVAATKAKGV